MKTLRVLSYNIHKGFSTANFNFVLKKIKQSIELVHADLVLLQEVIGDHVKHKNQFEFLADKLWPHYAYGKNAIYQDGHHGNAILSKFPIISHENINISTNRHEQRGLLHATINVPHSSLKDHPLHVICVHLDLFENGRKKQVNRICERIRSHVPQETPLIVGGDFNDWRENASPVLETNLDLQEVFLKKQGSHARTFPAWLPILKLDRIYCRQLQIKSSKVLNNGVWDQLSDHAAVYAELEF